MQLVLVSACLLGHPVRYDGSHKRSGSEVLERWLRQGRVVAVCPELAGGLSVPRRPAEVVGGTGGAAVLVGRARVVDVDATDLTRAFVSGARHTLQLAREKGIRVAVLKEGSPSCGTGFIHDGTFSGGIVSQQGVTSALLLEAGLRVFSEAQFSEADDLLQSLESPRGDDSSEFGDKQLPQLGRGGEA